MCVCFVGGVCARGVFARGVFARGVFARCGSLHLVRALVALGALVAIV